MFQKCRAMCRDQKMFMPDQTALNRMAVAKKVLPRRFSEQRRLRADYFTLTIYFCLFIADMFPQYDKGIYLDSDIVVPGDISRLYQIETGDYMIGACVAPDQDYLNVLCHQKILYLPACWDIMPMKGLFGYMY